MSGIIGHRRHVRKALLYVFACVYNMCMHVVLPLGNAWDSFAVGAHPGKLLRAIASG